MNRKAILEAAIAAVSRGIHGEPQDCFDRIAILWNAWLQVGKPGELTATDVAVMLVLMKIGRLANDPSLADSWIDLAGYAACGGEIAG